MATDKELLSIAEAFEEASDDMGGIPADESTPMPEAIESKETPEPSESVEQAESVTEEQSTEGAEETAPTKLSDLIAKETTEEEPATPKPKSLVWDDDMQIEVPDLGLMTLRGLREGNLRERDYTQKLQAIADQRRGLEDAEGLWNLLREDPTGTIATLAVRAGLMDESVLANLPQGSAKDIFSQKEEKSEQDIDALVAQKVQEVLESNPELSTMRRQSQASVVSGELDQLEKAYGETFDDADRLAIVQTAIVNQEGLELTYLKMKRQLERRQAEGERVRSASTKRTSSKVPTRDMTDEKPMSIREAYDWAVAEHS